MGKWHHSATKKKVYLLWESGEYSKYAIANKLKLPYTTVHRWLKEREKVDKNIVQKALAKLGIRR